MFSDDLCLFPSAGRAVWYCTCCANKGVIPFRPAPRRRSIWRASPSTSPWRTTIRRPLRPAARAVGFKGFGFYPRSGFIHMDLGQARSWGERFPNGVGLRRGDAAGTRGAGREPHAEGRGEGPASPRSAPPASRSRRRCWWRRRERHPAAGAVSGHPVLAVHHGGARWASRWRSTRGWTTGGGGRR